MAPARRLDSYGRPLPVLSDVRVEIRLDRPANQASRRLILTLLEDAWRELLRRGVYGEVTVEFAVVDGMIAPDVAVTTVRKWRREETE